MRLVRAWMDGRPHRRTHNWRVPSGTLLGIVLVLVLARPAWSQEAQRPTPPAQRHGSWILTNFGDQDVLLTVSSVEWGAPDRWSFTSRYIHMFDTNRDHKRSLNNLTVALSPGTGGVRLGVGYENIFEATKGKGVSAADAGLTLLSEARVVLLRTWSRPLSAGANRTFTGAELRTSFGGLMNVGAGYYAQPSAVNGRRESFWGVHVGVGM